MIERKNNLYAWLYLLPALILIGGFFIYPVIQTFRLSLYSGLGFNPTRFVGLKNYVQLLTNDKLFVSWFPPSGALFNNVLWLLLYPLGVVGTGLIVAVLSDRVKYEPAIKAVIFLPVMISATAASVIFRFLFSPNPVIGALNAFLVKVVPGFQAVPWLGRASLVNFATIIAAVWIGTGLSMTILSAAYKSIDRGILEAAKIDGANGRQLFWRISLPMMANPISFVSVTAIIASLKVLDLILVMTDGGPRGKSRVIAFTFYQEVFRNHYTGYGSAVAMLMLLLLFPLMVVQIKRLKKEKI